MNFLGHLLLSGNNHELMLTNLYGDYVKGSYKNKFPSCIVKGIKLHRDIDFFTDNHEEVKSLRLKLYKSLPRVAGIAIDIYFDHFLVKNWEQFQPKPLNRFLSEFYLEKDGIIKKIETQYDFKFHPHFLYLLNRLHKEKWIQEYINFNGLNFAFNGLSKRITFNNDLDKATPVLKENYDEIERVFFSFINDAVEKFNIKC